MILEITIVNYAHNMVPSISPVLPLLSFSAIPGKEPKLSRIGMGFKNKNKTHWSFVFPFPGKPEADGLKQTNVRLMKKSLSGWEWKPERTEEKVQLGEMMQRNPGSEKYTPWHWYKGQRGRTFWVLWSQEHSIKRRGKENVMIKWMKYIKAMHSPEGAQH